MLEAIKIYQDGMADEVLENIVAELKKRGNFGIFNEESMQLLHEGIWDEKQYALKYSQKAAGILKQSYDSKLMQIMFNGRTF